MSVPIELDRDRLRALLAELDPRLAARGISAGLYVVGGAAIVLTISERRLTFDVDALATDQAVYDEAATIARQHGLPPTWLNPSAERSAVDPAAPAPDAARNAGTPRGVRTARTPPGDEDGRDARTRPPGHR